MGWAIPWVSGAGDGGAGVLGWGQGMAPWHQIGDAEQEASWRGGVRHCPCPPGRPTNHITSFPPPGILGEDLASREAPLHPPHQHLPRPHPGPQASPAAPQVGQRGAAKDPPRRAWPCSWVLQPPFGGISQHFSPLQAVLLGEGAGGLAAERGAGRPDAEPGCWGGPSAGGRRGPDAR